MAQVMVLTHPKAAVGECDTYLAETLYPAQPVWFYGRSVTLQPAVAPEAAVASWWLDWPRSQQGQQTVQATLCPAVDHGVRGPAWWCPLHSMQAAGRDSSRGL